MLNTSVATSSRIEHPPFSPMLQHANLGKVPYGLPVTEDCISAVLREQSNSHYLSEATLTDLDRMKHAISYPAGALILVEGQNPRGTYVICQGQVKLTTTNSEGKTFIMKIAGPGEFLGLHAVVSGKQHELTVETIQPTLVAFVERADFMHLMKQHADLALHATQQISRDCQSAYDVIRFIGLSHSASEKLARLFLQWADGKAANGGGIRFKLGLTHEEIAQLIGTTRETVTRLFSQMKRERTIESKGATLTIKNKVALEKLVVS